MKTIINLNTREEVIEFLSHLYKCDDITSQMHPNRIGKKFFRYKLNADNNINFNIDYEGYNKMSVFDDKGNISELVEFDNFIEFVNKNKLFGECSDDIIIEKKVIVL